MAISTIDQELLEALLENPYECLILIDKQGIVRFMSEANTGIYNMSPQDAVGRHISEVNPRSQLGRILETGKAEIGESMILNSRERVIARFPICHKGEIIGAAGKLMFLHPDKLKLLYERINVLKGRIDYYKNELHKAYGAYYGFNNIIGNSKPIRQAIELGKKVAASDSQVLIQGESGTGKELFAHAIHEAGKRCDQPFVSVNCASIPRDLFESEFFGYEPGAFTGANRKGKIGKFEIAHGGTIFLDEIGDMPLNLQIKLLRVLQEKEIEPIGASKPRKVDFRLISATNQDIETLMAEKQFRLDLYYRINLVTIKLPPLRKIKTDIPLLVSRFLEDLGRKSQTYRISDEAMAALMTYSWPGNIRELKNVVERATIVCKDHHIRTTDLPLAMQASPLPPTTEMKIDAFPDLKTLMDETEKKAILDALTLSDGRRAEAAVRLGIHRTGLYQKMKKYSLI
ncbi:MAG: sigma 54-interacting transcriptional regulator [Pseudomonadota bacterium]